MSQILGGFSLLFVLSCSAYSGLEIQPGMVLDLGTFKAESPPDASFKLVNATSNTFPILTVESTCTCVEPVVYQKKIPPGATIPLDLFLQTSHFIGPFEEGIRLELGGEYPTNIILHVKGTAQPPLSGPPRFLAFPPIPLHRAWSTNLTLKVRSDIQEIPQLRFIGNPPVKVLLSPAPTPNEFVLQFNLSPQSKPLRWEGEVQLFFPDSSLPGRSAKASGNVGGRFLLSSFRVPLRGTQAEIHLRRIYPSGVPHHPAPIQSNLSGVTIRETSASLDRSRLDLSFSPERMEQIKKESNLRIRLSSEGFFPVEVVVQKQRKQPQR